MPTDDQRVRSLERSYALRVLDPRVPHLDDKIKGEVETRLFVQAWKAAEDQGLKLPCREYNSDLWFAEKAVDRQEAVQYCRECPIRRLCLRAAVAREEQWGVWGAVDLQGRRS